MAALSPAEFARALDLLSAELGFDRLKDRLARLGAFTSKRGLGNVKTLADRLYVLTGGLRRENGASYGFHSLWGQVFGTRVSEEDEKALGDLADRINECLNAPHGAHEENASSLDDDLSRYHGILARTLGNEVAHLDMVMKALPAVAERLRRWPGSTPPAAAMTAGDQVESEDAAGEDG